MAGTSFGGGLSNCGQLNNAFLTLLQASEEKIERFLGYTNYTITFYPAMANSSIIFYFCELNVTTSILATRLSQFTGLNFEYIFDILIGLINPPFESPLDCIESELMSYYFFTQNIKENIIPIFKSQVEESPINSNSSCNATIQYVSYYYQAAKSLIAMKKEINILDAAAFNIIGLRDLYIGYTNNIFTCQRNSLIGRTVDLLNGSENVIRAYLLNETSILPPPYSCVQGIIDSSANQMNDHIIEFSNSLIDPSPRCEFFLSQFITYQSIWSSYITNLTIFALSNAVKNPVLIPSFEVEFSCELNIMIIFAANATNFFSGVDSDKIYDILNGVINAPFEKPLDCVENYLISMQNKIAGLRKSFISQLQQLAVQSTANTSSCEATYSSLASYVSVMVSIISSKGPYVNYGLNEFARINFDSLYLDSMATMLNCVPNILGAYIGSALNGISNAVAAYSSGQTSRLPYPFSCVKVLINIYSSLLNQAIVGFSTNQPINLLIPDISKYQG
ncbi:unnamed protein product [Chironomus riparius]|uniref:Uncharacterized protein n=1 Tax=Chironomus riparius TaxID=315576 RepID=A0A9N9RRG6_9DIPT|nr:unnamed protein product [Chironomus riparius]